MKHIIYLVLLVTSSIGHPSDPGSSSIAGVVTSESGEQLIGASVALFKRGALITGAITDKFGQFQIINLDEGTYDIEVAYVGMQTNRIDSFALGQSEAKTFEIVLKEGINLESIVVTAFTTPFSEQDMSSRSSSLTNRTSKIRGSRSNATNYYLDGIRITGPQAAGNNSNHHQHARQQNNEPNTEDYDLIVENRFKRTMDEPVSTFSIDVDAASYSNIRRYLKDGKLPPKDAVRIEEMINYFKYNYPQPNGTDPIRITDQLGPCPWNPDHFLLHLGLASKKLNVDSIIPANLVFLIDVSGSMSDENKLPLLKQAFRLLIQQIRSIDLVSIVVYAGSAGLVLKPTTGDQKEVIQSAIDRLESGGSTAGGQGLKLAYQTARSEFIEHGNNRVILATDGDFNVGLSSDAEMVRLIEIERECGIFLSVLGFGHGNYKDNKMQKLADAGNGNHFYIDQLDEAKRIFVQEFGSTLFTVAKDVKLQIEFNPNHVAGYRLIGYENRLLNREDFEDDKKDAGDMGAGHSVTALYEIIPAGVKGDSALAHTWKLKYQRMTPKVSSLKRELATVKFRYKHPKHIRSNLLTHTINYNLKSDHEVTPDFKWAIIVSSFGFLLRESEWKGNLNFPALKDYISESKVDQNDPFKAELQELIEIAAALQNPSDN